MTLEKVLEIAHRYGCLELCNTRWVFSEDGLHRFVQAVIEEDRNSEPPNLHQFVSTSEELIDGKT
jgi:hypothetical protein